MTIHPPSPRRPYMDPSNPQVGARYSRLTVLGFAGRDNRGKSLWLVRCDCEREAIMHSWNVIRGRSTQCKFCGWEATRKWNLDRDHGLALNYARDEIFAELFRGGEKIDAIAARYGVGRGAISAALYRLRKKGIPVSRDGA